MIVLEGITQKYKDGNKEITVLDNYSVELKPGLIMVLGPSGCGKTTFLNIAGGLLKPTSGKVMWDDVDYYQLSRKEQNVFRNNNCGYIFQDYYLLEDLSPVDNVLITMKRDTLSYSERKEKAKEVISSLKLNDRIDWNIRNLSGGERQRIAIARALANDNSYIFCDEPTGNLDDETSIGIMDILSDISKRGKTIVMVTHNQALTKYADVILDFRKEA